jgi:rare lipoprotein A
LLPANRTRLKTPSRDEVPGFPAQPRVNRFPDLRRLRRQASGSRSPASSNATRPGLRSSKRKSKKFHQRFSAGFPFRKIRDPFHGRHAANGEVYDMYKLTAAHRTLPFETMVRVTNLNNGKSTVVRITDRGPFVGNRILDLSLAGAREIDSIGPGVVPIRLEVLGNVNPKLGFFTVQIGAFRERANAEHLRDRLGSSYSPIFIQQLDAADGGTFYRVRVGKISGEDAARDYAEMLSSKEGFTTMIFRLDDVTP